MIQRSMQNRYVNVWRKLMNDDSNYLQSPYYFMCCTLWDSHNDCPAQTSPESLLGGAVVSSLHRLKDIDNTGKLNPDKSVGTLTLT